MGNSLVSCFFLRHSVYIHIYICICTATYFDFIFCTGTTYGYVLRLEMHVRLICAIKFYLLFYLLYLLTFYSAVCSSVHIIVAKNTYTVRR